MKIGIIALFVSLSVQSAFASGAHLSCGNGKDQVALTATVAGNGHLVDFTYTERDSKITYPKIFADDYHGAKGDQYSVDSGDETTIHIYLPKNLHSGMKFEGTVNSSSFNFASITLYCSVK